MTALSIAFHLRSAIGLRNKVPHRQQIFNQEEFSPKRQMAHS
ncbi:MAG TPA: hypothetical protein DEB17_02740 [Chlorobaculum sp.]|uniref:Uncharacterized protein n=1 Tax=Chlorobaculum tepidum (strain ATCC 49652 / DSM 12025 / NBRC 103806 / TLS) TaxID=194439 RepID=Q8KED7_CHLTE|nr:hypothetical protein CT0752 [Chlorobaculum tepidum TLS]HBU22909.1 hypothetical protein [Chlorobaculum sp.]